MANALINAPCCTTPAFASPSYPHTPSFLFGRHLCWAGQEAAGGVGHCLPLRACLTLHRISLAYLHLAPTRYLLTRRWGGRKEDSERAIGHGYSNWRTNKQTGENQNHCPLLSLLLRRPSSRCCPPLLLLCLSSVLSSLHASPCLLSGCLCISLTLPANETLHASTPGNFVHARALICSLCSHLNSTSPLYTLASLCLLCSKRLLYLSSSLHKTPLYSTFALPTCRVPAPYRALPTGGWWHATKPHCYYRLPSAAAFLSSPALYTPKHTVASLPSMPSRYGCLSHLISAWRHEEAGRPRRQI